MGAVLGLPANGTRPRGPALRRGHHQRAAPHPHPARRRPCRGEVDPMGGANKLLEEVGGQDHGPPRSPSAGRSEPGRPGGNPKQATRASAIAAALERPRGCHASTTRTLAETVLSNVPNARASPRPHEEAVCCADPPRRHVPQSAPRTATPSSAGLAGEWGALVVPSPTERYGGPAPTRSALVRAPPLPRAGAPPGRGRPAGPAHSCPRYARRPGRTSGRSARRPPMDAEHVPPGARGRSFEPQGAKSREETVQ